MKHPLKKRVSTNALLKNGIALADRVQYAGKPMQGRQGETNFEIRTRKLGLMSGGREWPRKSQGWDRGCRKSWHLNCWDVIS